MAVSLSVEVCVTCDWLVVVVVVVAAGREGLRGEELGRVLDLVMGGGGACDCWLDMLVLEVLWVTPLD